MQKSKVFRTRDTSLVWPRTPSNNDASVLVMDLQLKQSERFDPARILSLQLHQLKGLLHHAFTTVPFYKNRLAGICETSDAELTLDLWRQIPILKRQEVQAAGSELHSARIPTAFASTSESTTSGSTGKPITIKKSAIDQLFFLTNNLRIYRWAGLDFSKSVANIVFQTAWSKKFEENNQAIPWATGHVSGPMYHFNVTRTTNDKIDWLLKTKPAYLVTYPSCLEDIIKQCQRRDITFPWLEHVITTSEMLDQGTRAFCETAWGVPVTDLYSSQETGIIAVQCPDSSQYHTMAESIMVEVLRDDDTPCKPGEIGKLVVTPLHNFVMPLIRYELGDYAEVGDSPCTCGRGLPVIKRICGRYRNLMVNPAGERFWPTQGGIGTLAKLASFTQVQIIQNTINELEVRLVVEKPLTDEQEDNIRHHFQGSLWPEINVSVSYVQGIPRSASGKFEDFICKVD